MNKEYIEREIAVGAVEYIACRDSKVFSSGAKYGEIMQAIQEAPAADVEPVRHGEWIKGEENSRRRIIECSQCKTGFVLDNSETNPNYCPNCGAKMDGGKYYV